MKKFLLLAALGFFAYAVQAQNVFNKGDKMLNVGIGGLSGLGFIPSINASMEMGVIPTGDVGIVSFGAIAAYKYANTSYFVPGYFNESYNYSIFVLGPRAAWHLQTFSSDKWDVYAGVGFGLKVYSGYTYYGNSYSGSVGAYSEGFVGGRMMMKDNFGLFGEVGYGTLSSIKIGITLGL